MIREIWPEGYRSPDWLESLTEPIPRCQPTNQRPFWTGVIAALCAFLFVACVVFSDDDGRGTAGRYVKSWHVFTTLTIALFGAGLAWVYASECRVDRYYDLWLKSKAKADAFGREWTPGDAELLRQQAQWLWNFHQNAADEIQEARAISWLRFFWKTQRGDAAHPDPFDSQQARYLLLLAKEVDDRLYLERSRERAVEDSWQVQLDAAKVQNVIKDKRIKGMLPINAR